MSLREHYQETYTAFKKRWHAAWGKSFDGWELPEDWPDRKDVMPLCRDQHKNYVATCAAVLGTWVMEDVSPFIFRPVFSGEIDMKKDYGIDPKPFFSLNDPDRVLPQLEKYYPELVDGSRPKYREMLDLIQYLQGRQLLGKNTRAKMAYATEFCCKPVPEFVRSNGTNSKAIPLRELKAIDLSRYRIDTFGLIRRTCDLLEQRLIQLPAIHPMREKITDCLRKFQFHALHHRIYRRFRRARVFKLSNKLFCWANLDWICQLTADYQRTLDPDHPLLSELEFHKGTGIEHRYVPRNLNYFTCGDRYGECTAMRVRSQVDRDMANIHWTTYSWILDPYYQIVEVTYKGKPALKGHVLPLIIEGRRIMMLDAIEAVPQLRRRRDGKDNPDLDREMFSVHMQLIEHLKHVAVDLCQRSRCEAVYIEPFSNAEWVREWIDGLELAGYPIDAVFKPYEKTLHEKTRKRLIGQAAHSFYVEIQAMNQRLMHQSLRAGYKQVSVIYRASEFGSAVRIQGP